MWKRFWILYFLIFASESSLFFRLHCLLIPATLAFGYRDLPVLALYRKKADQIECVSSEKIVQIFVSSLSYHFAIRTVLHSVFCISV